MQPNIFYAWLFIGAVIFTWIAGTVLVTRWPGGRALSLSGHGASNRKAYLIFAPSLTIGGIITYLFFMRWFIPEFHLPVVFKIIVIIFAILQTVTAWVPDTTSYLRRIHRIGAYSLAFIMPVELAFITANAHVNLAVRAVSVPVIVFMLFALYGYFFRKTLLEHYLVYQSAYIISCQLVIVAAILVR